MLEYKVLIREYHLDSYGHVNNATYLTLFEEARWEIITARGYGYEKVHQTGLGPVILEVNMKFLKELKLRETITITLQVDSYDGKVGNITQKMIKENQEIACELKMAMGLFDLKQRKLVLPTFDWRQAVGI